MTKATIAAVIPTRNRAEMAITAVRHLREQRGCDLRVFVSDNSSSEEEVRKLADFCSTLGDPRVTYMRAPENLGQGVHWDWALRQALARSSATHVTVHYDRKIVRPGQAAAWSAVAGRYPDKVFTYVTEFIAAEPPPLRLWRPPATGKLYALKTSRTIDLSARGQAVDMGHALPVLSNCLVPRAVVESVVARFGDFCQSTAADSCFAYRFCALYDDYLHLDRSLSILYGSHRSAGHGYFSGEGGDFADFRATWRGDAWLDAAPIPGVNLGCNMLFHEYELVRREVGGDRFPPIDRAGYLGDLARGLAWIRDAGTRAQMRTMLEEHGWRGDVAAGAVGESYVPLWERARTTLRERVALFRADHFGTEPENITGFSFDSDEHALQYAMRYPGRPASNAAHLAIVEPLEVDPGAP